MDSNEGIPAQNISFVMDKYEKSNDLIEAINQLRTRIITRESVIKESNNLFVSNDEMKIIKKHFTKLEKRINELEIKTINLQMTQYGK